MTEIDPNVLLAFWVTIVIAVLAIAGYVITFAMSRLNDSVPPEFAQTVFAEIRQVAIQANERYTEHAKTTDTQIDDIIAELQRLGINIVLPEPELIPSEPPTIGQGDTGANG